MGIADCLRGDDMKQPMTYASVCDGIGAVHVAWQPLGWLCKWTSEIDPFPAAVVDHHWHMPNLGDMLAITEEYVEQHGPIDLLVGGTPCQGFSVAGLRGGLDDPRSNLAIRFCQLVGSIRPRWMLWENVVGVRSSWTGAEPPSDMGVGRRTAGGNEASDFGCFLGALGKLGYGLAYRSLDAQYFGLAQRRERVFVVGYFGDWRPAAAVLFERNGLSGNPPPSRKAGKGVAPTISARTKGGGGLGTDFDCDGGLIANCLQERYAKGPDSDCTTTLVTHALRAERFDASEDGTGRGTPLVPVAYRTSGNNGVMEQRDKTAALNCNTDRTQQIIAYQCQGSNVGEMGTLRKGNGNESGGVPFVFQTRICRNGRGQPKEIADALTSSDGGTHADSKPHVAGSFGVRRLTPLECCRLQGFPDTYLDIIHRGKPASDSAKYKALGNSMAVPVMRWLGERIKAVEALTKVARS